MKDDSGSYAVFTEQGSCFLKTQLQFFHSASSAKNLGTVTIGPVASNHISLKMARQFIATDQTMYHSLSLTSSSQETVTDTEIPATRRSGSPDELAREDPLHE